MARKKMWNKEKKRRHKNKKQKWNSFIKNLIRTEQKKRGIEVEKSNTRTKTTSKRMAKRKSKNNKFSSKR